MLERRNRKRDTRNDSHHEMNLPNRLVSHPPYASSKALRLSSRFLLIDVPSKQTHAVYRIPPKRCGYISPC